MDAGHQVLVFSGRLRDGHADDFRRVDRRGLRRCYLDGATQALEVVQQFNRDDSIPVFLISLKAGGTGLNLTRRTW